MSFYGNNSGPLYLKSELHNKHSRLTLHNRVIGDNKAPNDTRVWGYGKEEFFINCARRRFKKDGFIAVKRIAVRTGRGQMEERYITMCLSSEKYHDEQNVWMLFRLFPAQLRNIQGGDISDAEVKSITEEELDDEFEGIFGRVSKLPIFNLVLPGRHTASEKTASHADTHEGGGAASMSVGTATGGGDRLDVGGERLDVSGSRPSDKTLTFKHENIPMTELPPTTVTANTTQI